MTFGDGLTTPVGLVGGCAGPASKDFLGRWTGTPRVVSCLACTAREEGRGKNR